MKKHAIVTALVLTLILGVAALAGCATQQTTGWSGNDNIPAGAAPLMPPTHEGRYDSLGADGCYGCHGANDQANPMLTGSVALPDDHYLNADAQTKEVDPVREQCITCHAQG